MQGNHISPAQLDAGLRFTFEGHRARFISWLTSKGMYGTSALFGMCQIRIFPTTLDEAGNPVKQPICAAIACTRSPVIYLAEEVLKSETLLRFLFLHELRHLPQFAYCSRSDLESRVSFPASVGADTEEKRKAVFRMFSNRAADMALHEDVRLVLGTQEFDSAIEEIRKSVPGWQDFQPAVVPDNWPKGLDWVTYMRMLIEDHDKQAGEGNQSKAEGMDELDGHGGADGDEDGAECGQTKARIRDILERAAQSAKEVANGIGREASDLNIFLPGGALSEEMRTFIGQMKVKLNRIAEGLSSRRYAYTSHNRLWPNQGLPGHVKHTQKASGIVVVLDTSGSVVGTNEFIKELKPVLLNLEKSFKVRASYSCDTELNRIVDSSNVVGGGGTQLDGSHVARIRKELELKEKETLAVVYVTDGFVDLTELNGLDGLDFHPLILPGGSRDCLG